MNQISAEEEQVLVEQARQGNEGAWRVLIEAYMEPLVGFLYNYLGNEDDARDAAQEAFARAIARLADYNGKNRFSTWLFAIGANRARDVLKSAANRRNQSVADLSEVMEVQVSGGASQPDQQAIDKEMLRELHRAIQNLPEKLRVCFTLYYFQEMSFEDIAVITKSTKGGVKVQISRAREYLARRNPHLYEYLKK